MFCGALAAAGAHEADAWDAIPAVLLKYIIYRFSEESNHQAGMFPQWKCRNRQPKKFFTLV